MATLKFILKNKAHSTGLFPIYLRVTKDRKTKLLSTLYYCQKSEWNVNKSEFRKGTEDYAQRNASLEKMKIRAEKIFTDAFGEGEDLSLDEFESRFFEFKKDKKQDVEGFWDDRISSLEESKQTGNARSYRDTKRSFFKFLGNDKKLFFKDITVQLLNRYEVFLRSNNGTDGGISVKMRNIRALYNSAIQEGVAKQINYPFNTYKISKFKNASNKRALDAKDVEKIRELKIIKNPQLTNSRNYFVFSYFTRGMNFYDMMMLKWENIEGDKINYVRRKTKGRFSIKITEPVQEILDYYKQKYSKKGTHYVFPILLSNDLTPIQIEIRKDNVLKRYNRDLKKIAELCEIDAKITSYVARHSFATNLKEKGVSTDVISEAMGHQNLAVTQAYLKELESSVIDDAVEKLL
ncbi:site-specific integrase [Chryseobacterium taklimakanense]|nr:site-specific integrase [Chryseobacterium taklimakanense]